MNNYLIFLLFFTFLPFGFAQSTSVSIQWETSVLPEEESEVEPWTPTAMGNRQMPEACRPQRLERALLANSEPKKQTEILQNFFSNCEEVLSRFGTHYLLALKETAGLQYDYRQSDSIRELSFIIKDFGPENELRMEEKVRAILAMKESAIARPLVIIKCGFLCSVSTGSLYKEFLLKMFDESPFHVLVISNITGVDHVIDNSRFQVGGFDGGRHIVKIANWLKEKADFSDKISSLHVFGVSKGAHSALYSALYHDQQAKKSINSFAAFCPVVDIEKSVDYLFRESNASGFFTDTLTDTLGIAFDLLPFLSDIFDFSSSSSGEELSSELILNAVNYYKTLDYDWLLSPIEEERIFNLQDFWRIGAFQNYVELTSSPILVWSPKNDGVVDYNVNAKKLFDVVEQKQLQNIIHLNTAHGNHCAFSLAYGWDLTSAIIRSYVLSHSPEFLSRRQEKQAEIKLAKMSLAKYEYHISQRWEILANSNQINLYYRVWDKFKDQDCWLESSMYEEKQKCYKEKKLSLNIAELPFPFEMPRASFEAEQKTRWFNTNIQLLSEDKKSISGSKKQPKFIQWVEY